MNFSPKLQEILDDELEAGNEVIGEYFNEFLVCKHFIVLKKPFTTNKRKHLLGIQEFDSVDTHYPVGKCYQDVENKDILMARF